MKKIFKKNHVIITALAIMIAVAGYLNFSHTNLGFGSKEASTDGSKSIAEDIESLDYDITDETALLEENTNAGNTDTQTASASDSQQTEGEASGEDSDQETSGEVPGEAVLTSADTFAASAKVSREQIRSQNREELQAIIDHADYTQEQKQAAIDSMVALTDLAEKENAAELLLEAQGFENTIVNLTGDSADVVVPMEEIPDDKRAQIEDIVKRKTNIAPENIVITPLNSAGETE